MAKRMQRRKTGELQQPGLWFCKGFGLGALGEVQPLKWGCLAAGRCCRAGPPLSLSAVPRARPRAGGARPRCLPAGQGGAPGGRTQGPWFGPGSRPSTRGRVKGFCSFQYCLAGCWEKRALKWTFFFFGTIKAFYLKVAGPEENLVVHVAVPGPEEKC